MEKRENFGRYIKEKRKAAGLSQKELATQLFVSESAEIFSFFHFRFDSFRYPAKMLFPLPTS